MYPETWRVHGQSRPRRYTGGVAAAKCSGRCKIGEEQPKARDEFNSKGGGGPVKLSGAGWGWGASWGCWHAWQAHGRAVPAALGKS